MALIRIGETLHCHIPSVRASARRWLCGDRLDREAGERHLRRLVQTQAAAGARYLDLNVDDFLMEEGVGREGALEIMEHILGLIVRWGRGLPPCIDSSDPEVLEWGLRRFARLRRGQDPPLLNSATVSRLETLALRRDFEFSIIGMLLERVGESGGFTDIAGPEAYHETARFLFGKAREAGFAPGEIFFDPTVGPLGADMVGYTRRTFEGIGSIRRDAHMEGVHVCIGLSNCSEGLPRRLAINRAYLRVAMEHGVDAAILDVGQVSGEDLVDGRILRLIRRVAGGEGDALSLLVDFAQGHPHPHTRREREPLPDPFGEALAEEGRPLYVLELAPAEDNIDQILSLAEEGRAAPFTFSITDTPGGRYAPGPDALALEVGRLSGRQPIVNLSCKSADRNGLIQRVLGLYHQGLRHFFAVTGDYPQVGRANFDLDAVSLLLGLNALRRGLDFPTLLPRAGGALEGLVAGAAVSPFKYLEPDLWGQYLKLWKKRRAGADYFITQLGFDPAKFHELRLYMQRAGMGEVPVLGMVYLLTPQVLRVLNRVHVAGVVIPEDLKQKYRDRLLSGKERARVRRMDFVELAAHQRRFSIRRAALLADVLVRGLGYRGVDLGGIGELDEALEILETIEELHKFDWRESYAEYREGEGGRPLRLAPPGGFYLFPPGEDGLLSEGPFQVAERGAYARPRPGMEWLHRRFFEGPGKGHSLLKWAVSGQGRRLRLATLLEELLKSATLGCEMCGDCRIAALHYRCPEPSRGCAKRLLNGPCGGADERGMCEVHPQRRCYWGEVLEAALSSGGLEGLYSIQLPKEPHLEHTSSWRSAMLELCPQALDLGAPGEVPPPDRGGE